MTCYDANCSYVAYVLCGDSATDCNESGSEPYKFSKGTTRKMPFTGNWDMGFRYVQILGIAQTSSPNASAWGYWSPDSI